MSGHSKSLKEIYETNSTGINDGIRRNNSLQDFPVDVFIAGGGPMGATYAKIFVEAGYNVALCELGAADSFRATTSKDGSTDAMVPGAHKKNEIEYQKDIDRFVNVIQGALQKVSVPVKDFIEDTLDPSAWGADGTKPPVTNGKNPKQDARFNLSAEAVTRGVGGMTTHWTCATPRLNPYQERPKLFKDGAQDSQEWDRLYGMAENLIGTHDDQFNESIRHTLVLKTLQTAYGDSRPFKALPLACHRMPNKEYVNWHATDTILEHIYLDEEKRKRFRLLTNHRCTRVATGMSIGKDVAIGAAEVKDIRAEVSQEETTSYIYAKAFVIAAGAVATPQILYNSGFGEYKGRPGLIPNLGKYITEQPMTFCQVVLGEKLLKSVPRNPYNLPWWAAAVEWQQRMHPEDPLQFPFRDPEPQVTTPFSNDHPWHTQIHRDAFSYGAVAETIDTRTIVDLRFFGYTQPRKENTLTFEVDNQDGYGMPQPTFHFSMSEEDKDRAHRMMDDMCAVAGKLGGYLPGSAPQFMAPGLALHLAGTTRAGLDPEEHVADSNCKVYGFSNLYVAGNGVIPTGFGANPTLTSICYAIRSAESIIDLLKGNKTQA